MAIHSNVFAWRMPGTGKPGGLLSMGSHRVGHDRSDLAAANMAALPGSRISEKETWNESRIPPRVWLQVLGTD